MSATKQDAFWLNQAQGEMGRYDASCELLHPDLKTNNPQPSTTETHYFGFNIPNEDIDGICYLVHRPNLGCAQGGVQVFRGIKQDMLASEIFDMRGYMGDAALENDITEYTLDNGYSFKTLEPGRKFQLKYDDPKRKNHIDIVATAASPVIVWPNGRHTEQSMHNTGEVVLRGKRYKVDSYHIRDRSWEGARIERPEAIPPIAWMCGALDDSLAFNCTSHDHPDLDPEWKSHFSIDGSKTLMAGWLWMDGEVALLKSAKNRVARNPSNLYPRSIELDVVDTKGRQLKLSGKIRAAAPIFAYMHQRGMLCQVRWETSDGRVLWGEIQEAQYTDFLQAMLPAHSS